MGKSYFFFKSIDTSAMASNRQEVYCPTGGYYDKNLRCWFDSKRQKRAFLASQDNGRWREAGVLYNPDKSIGGTEGCARKRRGSRGNFAARPISDTLRAQLERIR